MTTNKQSQDMGSVIFAQPASVTSQEKIDAALAAAGMPTELGEHLNSRSWFIRATKGLMAKIPSAKIRDKAKEEGDEMKFCFIARTQADRNATPDYEAVCTVFFNKKNRAIYCPEPPAGMTREQVEEEARKLLRQAQDTWEPGDIHLLVRRYVQRFCREVPLRPGVSFIGEQFSDVGQKLQKFYDALGTPYYVCRIGYDAAQAYRYQTAIIADLRQQVHDVMREIRDLKAGGDLKSKTARGRLKSLRLALKQYRDLAEATRFTVEDLIDRAGAEGAALAAASMPEDAVWASIRAGDGRVPMEIAELYAADAEIDLSSIAPPKPAAAPSFDTAQGEVGKVAISAGKTDVFAGLDL